MSDLIYAVEMVCPHTQAPMRLMSGQFSTAIDATTGEKYIILRILNCPVCGKFHVIYLEDFGPQTKK